jgi:hypothetical protein
MLPKTKSSMAVKLREKPCQTGQVSFLPGHFITTEKRWYAFLKIYTNRKKPTDEDKEKVLRR